MFRGDEQILGLGNQQRSSLTWRKLIYVILPKTIGDKMLTALKYKNDILEWFYLDDDDITIRRAKDDNLKGKFKKDDIVIPFPLKGNKGYDYKGIWIPRIGKNILLPWALMVLRGIEIEDGMVIDHIDGDRTNNSRDNLRLVSQSENCRNRIMRKDNTTGYTGLSFHKPSGRYVVRRTIKGKRIWKSHKTLEGAIEIWKEVEKLGYTDGYTKRHGY